MIERALHALVLGVVTVLGSAMLASLALMLVLVPPDWSGAHSASDDFSLGLFLSALYVSAPFTALGLVLIGLPADYVLRSLECRNPLAYAACGLAGGLVLVVIVTSGEAGLIDALGLAGMGYGVVTSLIFWALFRRWRPPEDPAAGAS